MALNSGHRWRDVEGRRAAPSYPVLQHIRVRVYTNPGNFVKKREVCMVGEIFNQGSKRHRNSPTTWIINNHNYPLKTIKEYTFALQVPFYNSISVD